MLGIDRNLPGFQPYSIEFKRVWAGVRWILACPGRLKVSSMSLTVAEIGPKPIGKFVLALGTPGT
jgi:hypothetical protein